MRVHMVRMGATAALALKRTEALLMMMKQYALPEAASLLEIYRVCSFYGLVMLGFVELSLLLITPLSIC